MSVGINFTNFILFNAFLKENSSVRLKETAPQLRHFLSHYFEQGNHILELKLVIFERLNMAFFGSENIRIFINCSSDF